MSREVVIALSLEVLKARLGQNKSLEQEKLMLDEEDQIRGY